MDIMVVINQMVMLFLIIGLGYYLNKIRILDKELNQRLTRIVLDVTTPALILSSVMVGEISRDFNEVMLVVFTAIILFVFLPIVSFLLVKIMRIPVKQQGLYMFMTMFSNIGFMGFPVMKAIFGDGAIFYTAIFNMFFNVLVFTLGILMMNYKNENKIKMELKQVLSPGIIASIVAVLIYILNIHVPTVFAQTCSMVGNVTTPVAMLLIGSTLANMKIKNVFNDFRVYPYTFIRQFILPGLSFPVLRAAITNKEILGITLIMIAMPVANSSVLFATKYNQDEELAAKNVFITTLVSVISIPMFVYLFLL
ncbi:MAG: AEC family transporter [Clostridiaceae bacterium]